ncbi:MAG TPA: hypothetical protein VFE03_03130 [Caulobacteraceae bacterium]|nr:hypothetical protein [Caulobacteraceae bacterium]
MNRTIAQTRTGPMIVSRATLEAVLPDIDQVAAMEAAFVAYSQGRTQMAAIGELVFESPPGDAHIKSGHIAGDEVFVVKVATGFYDNPKRGLPSSSGLVMVFDATTGEPRAILLDEGMLTDERTAAAGATAARHLAPAAIERIAILGAGVQARLQLRRLCSVTPCRAVRVWARRPDAAAALVAEAEAMGFSVQVAATPGQATQDAQLVVTTTPSTTPLLTAADIRPGTHITAVGADSAHKQELSSDLLAKADLIVADSLIQCRERGELRRAPDGPRVAELGEVIAGRTAGRLSEDEITIADLTGVAVQDIALAKAVLARLGGPA